MAPPEKPAAKAPSAPDPKLSAVELRRGLAGVRTIQLLVTEIQGLESLLSSTGAQSPDRPRLLRRLADSYVELETSGFRKKIELGMKADEAKRKDPNKVAGLLAEAAKAAKVETASRQAAIKNYMQLKLDYPRYCQVAGTSPATSSGCLDETLYNLAYEYEQAADLPQARKAYLELIQTTPTSKYVPTAYLAFGELFFQEAQGDPAKWALAEQSYKEVTRFPAPENKVLGYAHYKLAYVYWNKGDLNQAISELKKTIDIGLQFPKLPNADQLAVSARRDMIPLFAQAGEPRKAYDFIHPLSGDASNESTRTYRWMADLGQGYLDVGKYQDGIELYRDLQKRDKGPKSCEYQAHVTEAMLALKTGDKAAAKAELDRQLQLEQRFQSEGHPEEVKRACANQTASLAVETAMIWHLEAVGSGDVRGTMAPETLRYAADLYDKLVKRFTSAEFAKFEFPRVVKEDWPTLLKVKMARADLYYAQKDWARCGAAFDAVVEEDPRGALAVESSYASAQCYQRMVLAAGAARPGRVASDAGAITPRELTSEQKAMLASFDRFLCVAQPNRADKTAYDNYVDVAFARARTYFEAHHWPEAAAAFRGVALSHADHEAGIVAAQLYLEALNVMGSHGTPVCMEDMSRDLPEIIEKHCAGEKGRSNADQCGTLAKIQRDVDWQVIDTRVKQLGDGASGEHAKEWEEAANAYLRIWNTYGKEACEAKKPACERMDQVLFNAARAFQAARLVAKAIAVRKIMLEPRYNLERTPLARKTVRDIGANYQAIAVYDEAAAWYERFAHDSANDDKAPEALEDAIVLRLGLGQEDLAIRDADQFEHGYRGKHPARAAHIAFAIGAHYAEHEDYERARRRLSGAMSDIDRSGAIDVQIQAHAMLGRVLSRNGGESGAAAEYAKVRSLYRDPAAVLAKLQASGGDETRRLGKLLTAVGEAIFFAAEQKRRAVDVIHFPVYKGSGQRADVLAHINGKVSDWIKKKRPAIEEAEREYRKVVELKPAPPPRWVIASGARVGQMWGKFVAEFRAAPIPSQWRQPGYEEVLGAYTEGIDGASEPDRRRAKVAYQTCLEFSSKYQYFDEYSRGCEVWLSKNYGSEFHVVDELRGAPSRIAVGIAGQPALLAP
ncbi:TPR domain protein [Minicystis rosea]|nr:TPR domain protein [Minicystis rosea]